MKKQPIATQRILSSIFIALTLISIGGAIFINEQKKFLIPSYQLNSAAWIKENLPQNRTIISDGNKNLLTFHSVSRLIVIPKLYCDNTYKDPENILSLSSSHITDPNREQLKMNLLSDIQQYVQNAKMILSADIEAISSNYAHQINREPLQENNPEENMYIYYYSDDPRNPYVDRPYVKSRKDCSTPVFDQNPEHYKRIYHDGDRVIIWQVQ